MNKEESSNLQSSPGIITAAVVRVEFAMMLFVSMRRFVVWRIDWLPKSGSIATEQNRAGQEGSKRIWSEEQSECQR